MFQHVLHIIILAAGTQGISTIHHFLQPQVFLFMSTTINIIELYLMQIIYGHVVDVRDMRIICIYSLFLCFRKLITVSLVYKLSCIILIIQYTKIQSLHGIKSLR